MSRTIVGLNDPKAVKKFGVFTAVDTNKKSYFGKRFIGVGEDASMPIQQINDLESDAGDQVTYDLTMQLKMQPVEGDDILEGKEEALKMYTDSLYIDQLRSGVNTGGRMTRKRTLHNLRNLARKRQSDYWARVFDELIFCYASGARGINPGFIYPTSFTGFANNPLSAPDQEHIYYAGGTSKATMASTNKMALSEIDKVVAYIAMIGGDAGGEVAGADGNTQTPGMSPIMVDGEEHFVCVMNPWQSYNLRQDTTWLDIQKALVTAVGKKSPIFKGGEGMHNNVVLHSHRNVIMFNDYGSGGNVQAARALFLGEQGIVMAFGSPGTGFRFDWHEETRDNGNQVVISTSTIVGIDKSNYNAKDYGVSVIDTAAAKPV